MDTVLDSIRGDRAVVIYRGFSPRQCVELTHALRAAGLRLFEVTMNSEAPLEAIRALRAEFGADALVGAGTVLEPDEVDRVADAGAGFVISPDFSQDVVARTKQAGLVSIPGALSPTEIVRAHRAGADMVKVFPIRPVGADYIRQLRGPLPDIDLVATGGVDAALAGECVRAGCAGVGVGAHLLGARPGEPADTVELARQAATLLDATRGTVAA